MKNLLDFDGEGYYESEDTSYHSSFGLIQCHIHSMNYYTDHAISFSTEHWDSALKLFLNKAQLYALL